MKKYLISFGLIVAFVLYFVLQNSGSDQIVSPSSPPGQISEGTPSGGGTTAGSVFGSGSGPTPTPKPAPVPIPTSSPVSGGGTGNTSGMMGGGTMMGMYKSGTYTGDLTDAIYGPMQVAAVVSGGKLTDIKFLQYPDSGGHTSEVSGYSLPSLKQEAIAAQSANVDIVSGATQTSEAFQQSLASALIQAKS